jgi:eukaryotic translation initiation factor 2C
MDIATRVVNEGLAFHGELTPYQRNKLERYLMNVKVISSYANIVRKWRVSGLSKTSALHTTFHWINPSTLVPKEITVINYFKEKHGIDLKFPHLPCLLVGDPNKNILIPMELCKITPGQRYPFKLSEQQMVRAKSCLRKTYLGSSMKVKTERND